MISNPRLSLSLIKKIATFSNHTVKNMSFGKGTRLLIVRYILLLATMASYKKASLCKKTVVLDEGFFQLIHNIMERESYNSHMQKLIGKIPKPNVLVIVNSTKESRERRFKEKGYPRKDEFGLEYFNEWYGVMQANDLHIKVS